MSHHLTKLLGAGLAGLLCAAVLFAPPRASAEEEQTGEQIYRAACAACHGNDGRGQPRERRGFDVEPPDFSDCSFSSREADRDWGAVVARGGPARAFSELMPAFGEALTEAEIQRAVDHARGFCPEEGWPRGNLNFPRAMFTEKAFPEDEALLVVGGTVRDLPGFTSKLIYEQRFGAANQFEVVVPFAFEERAPGSPGGGGWKGGLGDAALGLKRAIVHSDRTGSILALAAELILPTGNADRDFGKGTFVFEPFLAAGQSLGSAGFVQALVALEVPFDPNRASMEALWRLVYGKTFTVFGGRIFSPMVEVLGAQPLESGASSEWDVVPQAQIAISPRQHLLANVAVRIPVEPNTGRAPQVFVYLLWDWYDGSLSDGW